MCVRKGVGVGGRGSVCVRVCVREWVWEGGEVCVCIRECRVFIADQYEAQSFLSADVDLY